MPSFLFRISARLYAGFGALVLFGVGLASFAVWQLWAIQGQAGVTERQSVNNARAIEISSELHAFRRAVLRYTYAQDEAAFAEAEKRLGTVGNLLGDAIRQTVDEQRRAVYVGVEKDITELKAKRVALGDAVKQMVAGRDLLFSDGDQMAADAQKFVDTAGKTDFAHSADVLEAKILQVRVANWRFLATRDQKGVATFKANLAKAQQQIAELEKADLPADLSTPLKSVKTGLGKYSEAFDKASTSLLLADELNGKSIVPIATGAVEKMRGIRDLIAVAAKKTNAETQDRIESTVTTQQIVAGGVALLGILIAFIIGRSISKPLSGLTSGMQELAEGNFGVVLPGLGRKDEIGDMAQAVETFKVKAEQKARAEAQAKMTQDQLAAEQRKRDMIKLADDFEGAVGEIIETVSSASTELEASAGTLTATAERSQELTTMVAAASEEASTNVQSVASATEEMASSVNEISRQVQTSASIASEAVGQARKTNDRVAELAQAASRIGDVVELINTIAGQTNLLALNATIEAARAGEAGRGFAVVASEVKALAEQTAKATGEISQQITGIQAATQDSVTAIKEIGDTIGRMSEIASTIAAAVEEQGAATQEISRNVQQAAQGTQQVSANITDVQRGATEAGSASSQVFSAAQSLSRDSNRLKVEVGKFLNTVRAA
ncbi:MAG: Methyl-accepting chemotaxis protein [Tardiphaga sp.]|jgi:methyl-accepting chemotaxis protein|nr:Methyl-accepting chemotaxis protein [Tardiphaga sp.]